MPAIRQHLIDNVAGLYPASRLDAAVRTLPEDDVTDSRAYLRAIEMMEPGDAVTIFTPVRACRSRVAAAVTVVCGFAG